MSENPSIQWFVRVGDSAKGPYSASELKGMADSGEVDSKTRLKRNIDKRCFRASRVKGLFVDQTNPKNLPLDAPVLKSHRGALLCALGVLSISCGLLGPYVWVQARSDLEEIANGTIDPQGKRAAQVAVVLGIFGTVNLTLQGTFLFLLYSGALTRGL